MWENVQDVELKMRLVRGYALIWRWDPRRFARLLDNCWTMGRQGFLRPNEDQCLSIPMAYIMAFSLTTPFLSISFLTTLFINI